MENNRILEIKNISKSFQGVQALDDVSFDIYKGEVLGLLGANGAGKSTLLKIIGGVQPADKGSLYFDGEELTHMTPQGALDKGIVSVYQELNLFSMLSIAENMFIGKENTKKLGTIDWKETKQKAKEFLDDAGLDLNPQAKVSSLSVAQQHMIEITKAMSENPKLLLLDEPTAALSEKEIQWLFEKIRDCVSRGMTIIYVSHRLDEIPQICDRCVILRDGKFVCELRDHFDKDIIVDHMIGHAVEAKQTIREVAPESDVVFECRNISLPDRRVKDVSFAVHKGEILGIAGLVGAGHTELLQGIFGIEKLRSGTILKDGKEIKINSPQKAIDHGICLVPESRKTEGLFLEESVRFNVSLMTLEQRKRFGLIDEVAEKKSIAEISEGVNLDTARMEHPTKLLSGGNQQKVVIAKTLLAHADVMLLDEPTRGVDVGAREEIYDIIRSMANEGKCVVLVSSDWDELISQCSRVIVMADGRATGELTGDEINQTAMMHLSVDFEKKKAEEAEGAGKKGPGFFKKLQKLYRTNDLAGLISILIGLIIIGLIVSPSFRSVINIQNLISQIFPYLLLAIGELIVIIVGGVDLSLGALMASNGVLGVTIMLKAQEGNENSLVLVGVLAMLGFSALVGLINGLAIVKAHINPFVMTLGMSTVLEGVALLITPKAISPTPKVLRNISNKNFLLGIPNTFFIALILIIIFFIVLRYTKFGRRLYAIGENEQGAYWAGIPVNRTKMVAYAICGLMAGLAGVFMIGRNGAADPTSAVGFELDAITCALIGGASLAGGRGSIFGVLCGSVVFGLLANILSMLEVDQYWRSVITGVLLLYVIISYELRVHKQQKKQSEVA